MPIGLPCAIFFGNAAFWIYGTHDDLEQGLPQWQERVTNLAVGPRVLHRQTDDPVVGNFTISRGVKVRRDGIRSAVALSSFIWPAETAWDV